MSYQRPEIEPTVRKTGRDGETVYEHPAFAQISANRISGHTTLYDSDFIHRGYVSITIRQSALHRNLSTDWHHGRDELISVNLSESQWATFVSAMNVGTGVPCTLDHFNGERIATFPHRTEHDEFSKEIQERVDKGLGSLRNMRAKLDTIPGLSKAAAKALLEHIATIERELSANLPFVAKMFDEHVEAKVEKAKAEIHGYMNSVLYHAGLQQLTADAAPLLIEESKP